MKFIKASYEGKNYKWDLPPSFQKTKEEIKASRPPDWGKSKYRVIGREIRHSYPQYNISSDKGKNMAQFMIKKGLNIEQIVDLYASKGWIRKNELYGR